MNGPEQDPLVARRPLEASSPLGGGGTTRITRDAFAATQNVASGGGFRYELARKFGLHAGIDVAHSPETTAVYFIVGNAWFRP